MANIIQKDQKISINHLPTGKHIMFIGTTNQTQKQAELNHNLCVNCTNEGKLKFNITNLTEIIDIINLTTELEE